MNQSIVLNSVHVRVHLFRVKLLIDDVGLIHSFKFFRSISNLSVIQLGIMQRLRRKMSTKSMIRLSNGVLVVTRLTTMGFRLTFKKDR